MRAIRALLLASIATVAIAAAGAQVQSAPALSANVVIGASVLQPGESSNVTLMVMRTCANQAQVLPAVVMQVRVVASGGFVVVTGPTGVALPQQVCAQQPTYESRLGMRATARPDVGANFTSADETLVFQVHSDGGNAASPAPTDAVVSTLLVVRAPTTLAAGTQTVPKSSPGVGPELALGLLGLGAIVRRRL